MSAAASKLLIGAHTSASGGAYNALIEGQKIGATTIQFFTANQKRWDAKPLTKESIDLWNSTLKDTGLKEIMSHDSYLINLGSPDPDSLHKSRKAMCEETIRCLQLGLSFLNFHPGAALQEDPQKCLDTVAESLLELEPLLDKKSRLRFLLEATAGQGSSVGHSFEQLAYIISKVEKKIPIGVCIDTCHIFAAGYDIRTPEAWDATLNEFDKIVGLKKLYAFHINDSVKGLGTRVDRHADLGEGLIGLPSFAFLMQDPRTREIPKYLETPGGLEVWEKEIKMLRDFASRPHSKTHK